MKVGTALTNKQCSNIKTQQCQNKFTRPGLLNPLKVSSVANVLAVAVKISLFNCGTRHVDAADAYNIVGDRLSSLANLSLIHI